MTNLLKFEFRKLFHSVSFYVCGGITLAITLINVFTLKATESLTEQLMGGLSDLFSSGLSGTNMLVSASGFISYTLLFPIAISIFLCGDFSEGTIRNIIARGYSRTQVFLAKLISGAFIATAFYLVGLITSFILGIIMWGFGSVSLVGFLSIIVQFLGLLAFSTMFSLLCFLFRKLGGALTLGIFVNIIFSTLFEVIDLVRELYSSTGTDSFEIALGLSEKGSEGFQFTDLLLSQQITNAVSATEVSELVIPLLAALGYGLLFTVLGYLSFRKKEF